MRRALRSPWHPSRRRRPCRCRRFGGAPGARSGPVLDGYAAVAYALVHAPTLLAQRATITSYDVTYTRDRAAEYPSLGGLLQNQIQKSANASGQFAQFGLAPVNNFSQNTAELQSTYNLFNGGAQLTAQQAKRTTQAAKYELRRLEEQTAIDVSNAFYNLAALHEVTLLDASDLAYQQTLLANARASERVGRVAGVDVLRAQVAVGRSRSTLVQARVDEHNAAEALAVQVGAPTGTTFALPKDIPEPPAPTTIGGATRRRSPSSTAPRSSKPRRTSTLLSSATRRSTTICAQPSRSTVHSVVKSHRRSSSQEQQQIDAQNAAALASYNAEKGALPEPAHSAADSDSAGRPAPARVLAVQRHFDVRRAALRLRSTRCAAPCRPRADRRFARVALQRLRRRQCPTSTPPGAISSRPRPELGDRQAKRRAGARHCAHRAAAIQGRPRSRSPMQRKPSRRRFPPRTTSSPRASRTSPR